VVGGSLGTEIFPSVDTGQLQVHLRAPAGTRIERTEQIALKTLDVIKREVGQTTWKSASVLSARSRPITHQYHLPLEFRL